MPLYEYECTACHKHTEKRQKFSDPELTVCPHCQGRLERVISAPAVSFKGGGWYSDLYSSPKPKSESKGESAASTSSSATESSSTPATSSSTPAAADSGSK
ncbi:MAG: zinc ribbon domain-containing protein [Acidobacteriaceae bacterium]|nr:zinc ribbon domain-containing protein [Acidobacteriaceae bacterium]